LNRARAVKVGLIGSGRVTATHHIPALQRLPNAEVIALADTDPVRLQHVANQFRIPHRYSDVRALLENQAVDVVGVCVPVLFHAEVALAAVEAGKHVFIEKPLTLTLTDADRLIERARRSSAKVMVGFNLRWHRLVRQARDVIQRGGLGSPTLMRTVLTSYHEDVPDWRIRRELGGGVLFEQAVHHFDLWRFLLQSEVEEVFATSHSGQWEDEAATVTARMANGVLVVSVFSERTSESHEVEVYSRAGCLRVSCHRFDGLEYFSPTGFSGDVRTRLRRIAHTLKELPRGLWGIRRGGDLGASYQAEWCHFIDAIRQDTPLECTLEDGRRALEVVLAAVASASLGQPIIVARAPRHVMAATADHVPGVVRRSVQE
jgi:myo-inositol 2-dehydrogenase/D-chiro-inositol 1-dehydrogenase